MGFSAAGAASAPWSRHPTVLSRRQRELAFATLGAGVPLLIAFAIATRVPDPNFFLAAGIVAGMLGLVALAASTRYEITLTILVLYFGLVDGVVKLQTANQLVSSLRDLMIAAICVGVLARIVVQRERVRLPPLSGWVIAFVVLTLVEAANPNTLGPLKVIGGFRQHLEWIPFFFIGYYLMRSKDRFRKLFLLLGIIALANGVVSTVQTQLTPEQLSSWGPGYEERITGSGDVSGRVYADNEGTERVRPPALGSDLGFGGFVGVLALPGLLALLGVRRLRQQPFVVLLCLGTLLAVATSLQRQAVLGAVIAAIALAALSASAGRRATKVLAGLLVIAALGFALSSVLAPSAGKGVFSRYETITPDKAATTSVSYRQATITQIPAVIEKYPLGAGLAVAGAGKSFGGTSTPTIDGHTASAESQYNYVTLELGLPGLILWVALSLTMISLAVRGLRRIGDVELRLCLAGVFATVIAFTIMGFVGPTMSNLPFGPFFWFALGIAAYWFKAYPEQQRRARRGLAG
jgi:O-Antigen ligase